MTEPLVFVGIDVAKATLDVAVRPTGATFQVANDPDGIAVLIDRLRPLTPALVVLEATGGYEAPAVAALQVAGTAGRGSGRIASAKWARAWASIRSVLANRPVALAKSRA